jgi:hypothetical protein
MRTNVPIIFESLLQGRVKIAVVRDRGKQFPGAAFSAL